MKTTNDSTRRGRARRRALVLLLVLAYIALSGGLVAIIAAGTAQLVRSSRHENSNAILRQLVDSGRAWAIAHPDQTIELDGSAIAGPDASAVVTVTPEPTADGATARIRVHARLDRHNRTRTRTALFPSQPISP